MSNHNCYFCNNIAQGFEVEKTSIYLCKSCAIKLHKQISQQIVPKSPTNIFIKQKEQSTYAK